MSAITARTNGATDRLLLIEDDGTQARMVEGMLKAVASNFEVTHLSTLADGKQFLRDFRVACVLLDLTLPDSSGLDGLIELLAVSSEAPIIVVTADDDESGGITAVQSGAQDYLVKGRMDGEHLQRAILYAIERQRSELLLTHRAFHDDLTGLPNSTLFLDRLTLALAQSGRKTLSVAVLFMDLNGFKAVNDGYGHAAGDVVLKGVAKRLLSSLRPGDTAARFGGDEFTMMSSDVAKATDATGLADRLIKEMLVPFKVGATAIGLSASIGIALAHGQARDADAVVAAADEAMYQAKRAGHSGYVLSASDVQARTTDEPRTAGTGD